MNKWTEWAKKTIQNPLWWWVGGIGVLILGMVIFLFPTGDLDQTSAGVDDLSSQEEIAVKFFQAVWVKGNQNEAESLMTDKLRNHDLFKQALPEWLDETQKNQPDTEAVTFLVESPLDAQTEHRNTYYLYRPYDQITVKIGVKNGKVSGAGLFPPESEESYQQLNQRIPGLNQKWKEVLPQ